MVLPQQVSPLFVALPDGVFVLYPHGGVTLDLWSFQRCGIYPLLCVVHEVQLCVVHPVEVSRGHPSLQHPDLCLCAGVIVALAWSLYLPHDVGHSMAPEQVLQ